MLRASRMVSQEANGGEGSNERALAGGHRVGVAPVRKKNASHPLPRKTRSAGDKSTQLRESKSWLREQPHVCAAALPLHRARCRAHRHRR